MRDVIKMARRFLFLAALMFWQGGFTFYGAVVVPVGSQVLGSHQDQGFVTQIVTNYMNLAGVVALALWAWDLACAADPLRRRRLVRWVLWITILILLGLLVWLHLRLDDLLDLDLGRITDRPQFRSLHAIYLNVSTIQWVGSLLLAVVSLMAWQAEDRAKQTG